MVECVKNHSTSVALIIFDIISFINGLGESLGLLAVSTRTQNHHKILHTAFFTLNQK